MKKNLAIFIVLLGIIGVGSFVWRQNVQLKGPMLSGTPALTTTQGGTGSTTPIGILYGDGSIGLKTVVVGSGLTFSSGNLSLNSSGLVPATRSLTINGTTYDLSANRTWTITDNTASTTLLSDQNTFSATTTLNNQLLVNNVGTYGILMYSPNGITGEQSLDNMIRFVGDDTYGYGGLCWYFNKADYAAKKCGGIIQMHHAEYYNAGDIHDHMSFYTLNDAGVTQKRLNIEALKDIAKISSENSVWELQGMGGTTTPLVHLSNQYATTSMAQALLKLTNGTTTLANGGFMSTDVLLQIVQNANNGAISIIHQSPTTQTAPSIEVTGKFGLKETMNATGGYWGNFMTNGTATFSTSVGGMKLSQTATADATMLLNLDYRGSGNIIQAWNNTLPVLTVTGGTQKVGIGTSTPFGILSVQASTTNAIPLFWVASSTGLGTGSTTAVVIDSNGKLGVGTSTPQGDFAVQGAGLIQALTINGIRSCSGTQALTTTAGGLIACGTITSSAASTTLLANSNTFSGLNRFTNTGTTTWSGGIETIKIAAPFFNATSTATSTFIGPMIIGSSTMPSLNSFLSITGQENNYIQALIQNKSSGANASSDLSIHNNLSTDSTYFLNLGMNGSGYTQALYPSQWANDSYLYASDGGLILSAATTSAKGRINFTTAGFATSSIRFTIDNNGNVGVGSTSPWGLLSIADISGVTVTAPMFVLATSSPTATSTAFIIDANGKVGIGTTTPSGQLSIQGDLYVAGNTISTTYKVIAYSTTTSTTASTTVARLSYPRPWKLQSASCLSTGGTAWFMTGIGTASTSAVQSNTTNTGTYTTISTNNNFSANQAVYLEMGGWSGTAVVQNNCTISVLMY